MTDDDLFFDDYDSDDDDTFAFGEFDDLDSDIDFADTGDSPEEHVVEAVKPPSIADSVRESMAKIQEEYLDSAPPLTTTWLRVSYLQALGAIGDPSIIESVRPLLTHDQATVRFAAAYALGRVGDRTVIPALLEQLLHGNPDFLSDTVEVLLRFDDPSLIPHFITFLREERRPSFVVTPILRKFGEWGDLTTVGFLKEYAGRRATLRTDVYDEESKSALEKISAKLIAKLISEAEALHWYASSDLIPIASPPTPTVMFPTAIMTSPEVAAEQEKPEKAPPAEESEYDKWISALNLSSIPTPGLAGSLPPANLAFGQRSSSSGQQEFDNWIAQQPTDIQRMRTSPAQLVQLAINKFKAGDKAATYVILLYVTEIDEYNELGWLWLSGVVETIEEQITCLENVLAINPGNDRAHKGLDGLRKKLPPKPVPPPPEPLLNPFSAAAVDLPEGPFGTLNGFAQFDEADELFGDGEEDLLPAVEYSIPLEKLQTHPILQSLVFRQLLELGEYATKPLIAALEDEDTLLEKDREQAKDIGIVLVLMLAELGLLTDPITAACVLKHWLPPVRFAGAVILNGVNWSPPKSASWSRGDDRLTQQDFIDALNERRTPADEKGFAHLD